MARFEAKGGLLGSPAWGGPDLLSLTSTRYLLGRDHHYPDFYFSSRFWLASLGGQTAPQRLGGKSWGFGVSPRCQPQMPV